MKEARAAADSANKALHRALSPNFKGLPIHEILPVKFGGSPTNLTNKIILTVEQHVEITNWWAAVQRLLEAG